MSSLAFSDPWTKSKRSLRKATAICPTSRSPEALQMLWEESVQPASSWKTRARSARTGSLYLIGDILAHLTDDSILSL
eukprot:373718-Hanusia_phi.AAC.2